MTESIEPHALDALDKEYRGLIFDCDGTLTDSMPVHYVAWVKALTPHGIVFSESRFYELGGVPTTKIISMLAEEQGRQVDVQQVSEEKESQFLVEVASVKPNPPVCAIVQRYAGRLPMAVASGGLRSVIFDQLRVIEMEDVFDAIVGAEDTQLHKPNPDVFLEAARRLNVPPQACLVFEDTDIGITAAQRASMNYVDVRKFIKP